MRESQKVLGLEAHLKKLRAMADVGEKQIPQILGKTALLGVAEIQKIITNEIEPHNRRGVTVTNLVDTGFYRSNWHASPLSPTSWLIHTNTAYAAALEYGIDGTIDIPQHTRTISKGAMKGKTVTVRGHKRKLKTRPYYVVRRAKIRIRRILRDNVREAINKANSQ